MTHVNTHTNQASKKNKRRGTRARRRHDARATLTRRREHRRHERPARPARDRVARAHEREECFPQDPRSPRARDAARGRDRGRCRKGARGTTRDATRTRARGRARERERELRAWPRVGMIFARVRAGRELAGDARACVRGADRRGRRVTSAIRRAWITGDGNARCRGDDAARARSCAPCEMKDTDGCAYET